MTDKKPPKTTRHTKKPATGPVLLSGGNPQIAKAGGQCSRAGLYRGHAGLEARRRPPGKSKHKDVRYLDIYEGELDETRFVDWVKQASRLPGERM